MGALNRLETRYGATNYQPLPVTLVRGGSSGFVTDEDATELARRARHFRTVHVVENSGHSVQSDQPRVLIDILRGVLEKR